MKPKRWGGGRDLQGPSMGGFGYMDISITAQSGTNQASNFK